MIKISTDELARWRAEIELGVEFRDKEFGTYRKQGKPNTSPLTSKAGRNIEYFEQGARVDDVSPPLNVTFPIVKNVLPNLFFQNPRASAVPDSDTTEEGGEDAFYVSQLINRDLKDSNLRIKETGQQATWDGYVTGLGEVKIGYATEFGADVLPTEKDKKKTIREKTKELADQALVALNLKSPKEEELEPEKVQAEEEIRSESAYIKYISPFDFVKDPRLASPCSAKN